MKTNKLGIILVSLLLFACFLFLVYGCGSSSSSGGSNVPQPPGILYAASNFYDCIMVFDNANTIEGTVMPDRIISGPATSIDGPRVNGLFIDTVNDRLYVSCGNTNTILVFENASTLEGNKAPSRSIGSAAITSPYGIFVRGDRLYLTNGNPEHNILVFDPGANGSNVAPLARLTCEAMYYPYDVYVDASDAMYVAFASTVESIALPTMSRQINVFNNVTSLAGTIEISADRIIYSNGLYYYPAGVWVDEASNKMFVTVREGPKIAVFNNANTKNGICVPDATCSSGISVPMSVAYNGIRDIIYTAHDNSQHIINAWDNAGAITDRSPDRTVSPEVFAKNIISIAVDPTR